MCILDLSSTKTKQIFPAFAIFWNNNKKVMTFGGRSQRLLVSSLRSCTRWVFKPMRTEFAN